jgi:cellulose synthase/poly-beta-1,6-N-acetylglucosamine synthase-like glycosyltransferase
MMTETVFALSAGFLLYVLVFYPAAMAALGTVQHRRLRKEGTPGVAVIVAACNEERHIGAMMEQLLRLDYPKDRLELVVASDAGSTDRTHEIVHAYAAHGIRLCLPPSDRIGKNVSLDEAVRTTTGDILVFADATARWHASAVRELAADFADARVGCVSACKAYWLEDGFGPESYRRYWSLEALVDQGSSLFGYVPNASGGLHALRREIYRSVPGHMIRDLVDPAQAAGQGYLAILDPDVPYTDAPWVGAAEVYRSRVRITMRALSSSPCILALLAEGRRPFAIFQYVSHKLLRWFLWLPACGLLASSAALGVDDAGFAAFALVQAALYASVPLAVAAARAGRAVPVLTGFAFFALSLAAMAHGFLRWLRGAKKVTWRSAADLRPVGGEGTGR